MSASPYFFHTATFSFYIETRLAPTSNKNTPNARSNVGAFLIWSQISDLVSDQSRNVHWGLVSMKNSGGNFVTG